MDRPRSSECSNTTGSRTFRWVCFGVTARLDRCYFSENLDSVAERVSVFLLTMEPPIGVTQRRDTVVLHKYLTLNTLEFTFYIDWPTCI